MAPLRRLYLLSLASASVLSCQKGESHGPAVAEIDGARITADELQQQFLEMPPSSRARYQSPQDRKQYVESRMRFEVLAEEARRRGLQNDPDVVLTAKRAMVQKLLQEEEHASTKPASDAELAAAYEKHKSEFVKPETVRLWIVFLAVPKTDVAARKAKRAQAEELAKKAKALPLADFGGFGRLARESSDDLSTRVLDGDTRFVSLQEVAQRFAPEVAAEAAATKQIGVLSPVVETERGFYLFLLRGRQAPLNLTLDQAKPQLEARIASERRQENVERFISALEEKFHYKVDDAALAAMKVDLAAPAREPKGPPPGLFPTPPGR